MNPQRIFSALIGFLALTTPVRLVAQDHENIELVSQHQFETTNGLRAIAYQAGFCYMLLEPSEFRVIDVRDPEHPRQVDTLQLIAPRNVAVTLFIQDTLAIVIGGGQDYMGTGVWIVSLANPEQPQNLGFFETQAFDYRVATSHEGYLYLTTLRYLLVYEVLPGPELELTSTYYFPGSATAFSAYGNKLAVSMWNIWGRIDTAGVVILDISNPTDLRQIALLKGASAFDAVVERDYLAVNEQQFFHAPCSLIVYDIRDADNIRRTYSQDERSTYYHGTEDELWLNREEGFDIIDISDPESPYLSDSIRFESGINHSMRVVLSHEEDRICLGLGFSRSDMGTGIEGFSIEDISDRHHAQTICYYAKPMRIEDMIVKGTTIYFDMAWSIKIVDARIAADPVEVGTFRVPGLIRGYHLTQDNILFVGLYAGTIVSYDVSDPLNVRKLGSFTIEEPLPSWGGATYTFSDRYCYLACEQFRWDEEFPDMAIEGISVVDLSDPENMQEVSIHPGNQYYLDVGKLVGNLMYGYDWGYNINDAVFAPWFRILDISDPINPQLLSETRLRAQISSFAVNHDHLFVVERGSLLLDYDVSNPDSVHIVAGRVVRPALRSRP